MFRDSMHVPIVHGRMWISLVALIAVSGTAFSLQQTHHKQGGLVTWPWVAQYGHEPLVWTSEDGARVRLRDTLGTWHSQEVLLPSQFTGAPKDPVLRFIRFMSDAVTGLVVGDRGLWAYTFNGQDPAASYTGVQLFSDDTKLWASYMCEAPQDPPAGDYWVVGTGGLIASTDSLDDPLSGLQLACFENPTDNPVYLNQELHGIDFVPGTSRAVAVGHESIWYCDVDVASNCWKKAAITWTDNSGTTCGTSGNPCLWLGQFTFWKIAFIPSSSPVTDPDTHTGYAVGGFGNQNGRMFVTHDGGKTWRRELYECDGVVSCAADTSCVPDPEPEACPPYTKPTGTVADRVPSALYGVTTFLDGSAIAVGYGSAILQRDPYIPSLPNLRPWKYSSNRCMYPTPPLWGVHCDPGSGSATGDGQTWITGGPNQVRHRFDNQTTWTEEGWNKEWRFSRVAFVSGGALIPDRVGWVAGQRLRIAKTTDGGVSWTEQHAVISGSDAGKSLSSLAFYNDGNTLMGDDNGVAVGPYHSDPSGSATIYYTRTGGEAFPDGTCGWLAGSAPGVSNVDLKSVCFSGRDIATSSNEYWACGETNTVLHSINDGESWTPNTPPAASTVLWSGISFVDRQRGFVVGTDSNGIGIAYRYDATQTPAWVQVALVDEMDQPISPGLRAVHALSSGCFAVGTGGSVLQYDRTVSPTVFRRVQFIVDNLTNEELNSVKLVANGAGREVFVGGKNGILLHRTTDPAGWDAIRSRMSGDITDMCFLSASSGYLVANGTPDLFLVGAVSCLNRWE